MSLSLADQYFLKASENYDYDIEQSVEALNYALSYDETHAAANCLMGRVLMEKLKRFSDAKHFFEIALVEDPQYVDTYKYYSMLLIWLGKFEAAAEIILKGLQQTGMPKMVMIQRLATLLEAQGRIDLAIAEVKRGKLLSNSSFDYEYFDGELGRLKRKCKTSKKKSRKKQLALNEPEVLEGDRAREH